METSAHDVAIDRHGLATGNFPFGWIGKGQGMAKEGQDVAID